MSRGTQWVVSMCLLVAAPALAEGAKSLPAAERYAKRCQPQAPSRIIDGQGTMLWGTWSGWTDRDQRKATEQKNVLVSANLGGLAQGPEGVKSLSLEGGHLAGGKSVVGAVLQGTASDGQPVEVAICGEEPAPGDPGMVWYRIQAWNQVAQEWSNPCVPTGDVPNPRALALGGVWDEKGARRDEAGKITFACETGVLSKCARWGYKPWANRDGRSLADAHQACTRMARADYCGNGKSHTQEKTTIEYYDSLGIAARTTKAAPGWDPARAAFEANWAPDGASCLARSRHGEPLEQIQKECPGRFRKSTADLGDGDHCAIERTDRAASTGMLRNRVPSGPAR